MVLYMVGLGLGDEDDITLKGYKILKKADVIFLEAYTSVLLGNNNNNIADDSGDNAYSFESIVHDAKQRLERAYELTVPIQIADRDLVEQQAEELILQPAQTQSVVFLVVGDPVCATTHVDLHLRAKQAGISVEVIHNASIMGAAGSCGLQLYNFGQTVSLPFWESDNVDNRPISFYPKILYNRNGGMHTLCLLDIKVKELDYQAIIASGGGGKKKHVYLPPRFMTIPTAVEQLLFAEEKLDQHAYDGSKTLCVGLARMGVGVGKTLLLDANSEKDNNGDDSQYSKHQQQQNGQLIVAGTLKELQNVEWGGPLHSLIICGDLHDIELQALQEYMIPKASGGEGRSTNAADTIEHDTANVGDDPTYATTTRSLNRSTNSSGNPSDEDN